MSSSKVRVAIVGVGNCASSLVQGVRFYTGAAPGEMVPGLMHVELGGYHVSDVEFVAAFDVNASKVGRDLGEAVFAEPNNTLRFCGVGTTGVRVRRGPTLDGLGKYLREAVKESDQPGADVAAVPRESGAGGVVSLLPGGSEEAARV